MQTIFMADLDREAISERARGGGAIIVPLAATEQHGPHLPVSTDSLICDYIVRQATGLAAQQADVLVAPLVAVGSSHHHLAFGGTISYSSITYLQLLRDIGESLVKAGFGKIIFLNGHGGNEPAMVQTANDLAVAHPIWTASASYWSIARERMQQMNASELGMVPGHAGGFETAAVMALRPELVREEKLAESHTMREWINAGPAGTFVGKHGELTGYDGYTDAPFKATAAAGQRYLDAIVEEVGAWLVGTVQAMERGGACHG